MEYESLDAGVRKSPQHIRSQTQSYCSQTQPTPVLKANISCDFFWRENETKCSTIQFPENQDLDVLRKLDPMMESDGGSVVGHYREMSKNVCFDSFDLPGTETSEIVSTAIATGVFNGDFGQFQIN